MKPLGNPDVRGNIPVLIEDIHDENNLLFHGLRLRSFPFVALYYMAYYHPELHNPYPRNAIVTSITAERLGLIASAGAIGDSTELHSEA